MKVRYINRQDNADPMNNTILRGTDQLASLLDARRKSVPFIAELSADNGFQLMIGIGGDIGFAQYSRTDGELPYLVASPGRQRVPSRYVDFLTNNTPTPIPGRYILNFDEVRQIALHFLQTGDRSEAFIWESI